MDSYMNTDVIVGLQHGDEGKGKVMNWLLRSHRDRANINKYDYCVRFNGGPNAGHTIYINNSKIVLHQIPIGIVYGIPSIIGPACVLDIDKLEKEKADLRSVGITNIESILHISYNTHIIDKKHIEEDRSTDKVGSTLSGIRPTYRDKYNRRGTRVENIQTNNNTISGCKVIDPYELFYKHSETLNILCEGAQGFELDIDWGDYPFVTSSNCIAGFCCTAGIPSQTIKKVYGIAKIYETYVGKKSFQPDDDIFKRLQVLGNEFGATTGRPRQCNWLNLRRLVKAIYINGVTDLIINKCDIIQQLGVYKLIDTDKRPKSFNTFGEMKEYIIKQLGSITFMRKIIFSKLKDTV